MKQEHAMTPGVLVSGSDMSAGDYKARCAVLEDEVAELRKRVCVPEGWRVVPVELINRILSEAIDECYDAADPDDLLAELRLHISAPAPVERLATDGGRNQRFEGLFEGETPDQRDARLASAASVERNQCDGCQAGIPVESGMHRMGKPGGYPDLMACTADRYGATPVERVDQEALRKRFDEIEREICEGKHTAASVFTQMRTAALYTTPQPAAIAAQDVAGLVEALRLCVASLDQLLPYLAEVPADIGALNNALCAARPLLAAHQSGGAK